MISNLLTKTLSALKTSTVRQSSITMIGTIVTGALGMVFYIFAARALGTEEFAIFSVSAALITLLASVADVGTNTGIVRFTAGSLAKNKVRALRFLKLGFKIKIVAWIVVSSIGWLAMPYITNSLLQKPELLVPFRWSMIGVGGLMLFSFSMYSIQALQKYKVWASLSIANNLVRLIGLLILMALAYATSSSTLSIYIVMPFLGFAVGLFFIPNFFKVKGENKVFSELFNYNKWVATFTILSALSTRLDTFMITRFLTLNEVGIYQVAKTLSDVVPQIVFALGVVVAPKLSGFNGNHNKAIPYLRKLQVFVVGLAFLGILFGLPIGYYLIPQLYGFEYFASILPFAMLLVAQALFLISVPVHTAVIYYFSYPKLFVWISSVHMAIIAIGGWTLIPLYGYIGAALVVFLGSLSNFAIPAIWVVRKFRQS